MLKVKDIVNCIQEFAPPSLKESWDNCGLLVGSYDYELDSALISLDVTEAVIDEAIETKCGLVIAHHPIIFSGVKQLTGRDDSERAIIKAIKNDISIFVAHTNIDVVRNGVSWKMAEKLGLKKCKTLIPTGGLLKKLVTFVPTAHAENVREAIFKAGAGHIGNYDSCSYTIDGKGSFRGDDKTMPFVGEKGKMHFENEVRIETIFPSYLQGIVLNAMIAAHPYEEVAYDIYPLENKHQSIGLGVVGELEHEVDAMEYLRNIKQTFNCEAIRHTSIHKNKIKRIAMVGGAGSSYLRDAIKSKADLFITGDFKYHQYFEAENKIIIADIGHFESEQFTKELFYEIVTNKFPKFALRFSKMRTNPVNHLC